MLKPERLILGLYGLVLFVAFFFVPSESGLGPGGVLTAILSTGGHPNPPGYQTIGIVGEIWNSLPHSNPFLHFNRLGFLIGCGCLFAAYRFFKNFKSGLSATLVVGLILLSATFHKHLLFFDRYLLACLFMFLGFDQVAKIEKNRDPISWLPLGVLLGLAFVSHLFAAVALATFMLAYFSPRRWLHGPSWIGLITGGLAGLVPIIWSFHKGLQQTFFNWGEIRSWQDLELHMTRFERGTDLIARSAERFERQLGLMASEINSQFFGTGVVVSAAALTWLAIRVRDRLARGLLVATLASFVCCLVFANFNLGPPGSATEEITAWFYTNYLLQFHLLVAFALASILLSLGKENQVRVVAVSILVLGCLQLYRSAGPAHTYPSTIRHAMQQFPPNSLVFTQTDSLYFPLEAHRLNSPTTDGPIFVHTHLLARPWYIRALLRSGKFPDSLTADFKETAKTFENYAKGKAPGEAASESITKLIYRLIQDFESQAGAFIVDFKDFEPAPHTKFYLWSREPWGIGERLFKDNSETREIKWSTETLSLVEPQCHPSLQTFCKHMAAHWRDGFEKRSKFIQAVFPDESAEIKKALHL